MSLRPELLRLRDSINKTAEDMTAVWDTFETLYKKYEAIKKELAEIINNVKE